MQFTYLKKYPDSLYVLISDKEVPKETILKIENGEFTKDSGVYFFKEEYEHDLNKWLSSCKKVKVHPSQEEKFLNYIAVRESFCNEAIVNDRIETGTLLPEDAVRVDCRNEWQEADLYIDIPYAFLNEETKEEGKESIITTIKNRIESEYKKHKQIDWSEIAARKIYSEFIIKRRDK